jgi:transposase
MRRSEPNLTGAAHDVTALLHAWSDGDIDARDRLVTLIYQELRRRAAAHLRRERRDHTLQPTALVNEAYLRLVDQRAPWQNRQQFFCVASQIMRRVLVDAYQERIAECDQTLEQHLKGVADKVPDTALDGELSPTTPRAKLRSGPKRRRKAGSHAPQFDLGRELHRISGVDLTRIDGIDVGVTQTVLSEVGLDMTRWKTEAHFASWLGLCPDNRITGGKVIRKGTRHVINRAATSLRLAATTLLRSQSYLGAQYRRLRARLGAPKAITAMAHKLARLVYRMLKWGHEYVDKGLQYYEERHRLQQVHLLKKRAAKLGLQIVEP